MNPVRSGIIYWACSGAGFLLLLGAIGSWAFIIPRSDAIIMSAVDGTSIGFVNTYVAIHHSLDPENRTQEYFTQVGGDVLLRLSVVLTVAGLGILFWRRLISRRIQQFSDVRELPEPLALFRIAVAASILYWLAASPVIPFLSLPAEFVKPPPGLSWVPDLVSMPASAVMILQLILGGAALMLLIGFRTIRASMVVATSAVILMGVPQFFGKIDHYHHLVWFAALLSVSRCSDVWSVDALLRRRQGVASPSGPSKEYGLPLRLAMALIGLMYFFPGVWKVIIGGWDWPGETMRYQMFAKWMSVDWIPLVRLDEVPALLSVTGTGVIIFELTFLFLIMSDRWRPWIAFGGILFHIGIYVMMDINFWSLIVCYVVFIDGRVFARTRARERVASPPSVGDSAPATAQGPALVGATLILLSLLAGTTLIDSWPVAVYPTFAGVPEPNAFVLTFSFIDTDGTSREVRPLRDDRFRSLYGASRAEGLVHQVVWEREPVLRARKAELLFSVLSGIMEDTPSAARVTIERDLVSVNPSTWNAPPLRREELAEIAITEGSLRAE